MSMAPASSSRSPFAPVRRVVTGHTSEGKSTVVADTIQPPTFWSPESISPIYDLCRTGESPAAIDSEIPEGKWVDEIAQNPEHVSKDGSVFRVFEFSPGTVSVCRCSFYKSGTRIYNLHAARAPNRFVGLWDRCKGLYCLGAGRRRANYVERGGHHCPAGHDARLAK